MQRASRDEGSAKKHTQDVEVGWHRSRVQRNDGCIDMVSQCVQLAPSPRRLQLLQQLPQHNGSLRRIGMLSVVFRTRNVNNCKCPPAVDSHSPTSASPAPTSSSSSTSRICLLLIHARRDGMQPLRGLGRHVCSHGVHSLPAAQRVLRPVSLRQSRPWHTYFAWHNGRQDSE